MGIYKLFDNIGQFISEAVARIFGPNEDSYPATGVQPFAGEPYRRVSKFEW